MPLTRALTFNQLLPLSGYRPISLRYTKSLTPIGISFGKAIKTPCGEATEKPEPSARFLAPNSVHRLLAISTQSYPPDRSLRF